MLKYHLASAYDRIGFIFIFTYRSKKYGENSLQNAKVLARGYGYTLPSIFTTEIVF